MKYTTSQSSRLGNRAVNQDRCAVIKNHNAVLLLLADGLGGRSNGELAAQRFIDVMSEIFYKTHYPIINVKKYLQQNILAAHREIQKISDDNNKNPYTTCVCALVHEQNITWAHAGDSRLYLYRKNQLLTRTRDHSYIEELISQKLLSEKESAQHPMRNCVTACLGHQGKTIPIRFSETSKLQTNDIILLCSDGLWSAVTEEQIIQSLSSGKLGPSLDTLTELAEKNAYPASDNVTAIAFTVEQLATDPINISKNITLKKHPKAESPLDAAIKNIESAYHQYKKEIQNK